MQKWAVDQYRIGALAGLGIGKVNMYDRLIDLAKLPSDWDGYGASPIDGRILDVAKNFAFSYANEIRSTPAVVPMTRGRLQFEWHRGGRSLEIEFESPENIHYLKWDDSLGIEEEDIIPVGDRPTIAGLLNWFSAEDADVESTGSGATG